MRVFIGREAELAALREAPLPGVVLIAGEPGIGKTALAERFLGDLDALRANGDETEVDVTLGVIDQLLRRAGAGPVGDADHVAAGTRLLDALDERIVFVDDAHWADTLSLRALLFTARRLATVVLTCRTDELERLPAGLRSGTTVRLSGLSVDEVRSLGELSPRAARRLHEHTQGNPLYATALLEEVPRERWEDDTRALPAPRSFASLVLGRATGDARTLAEAVAVLGTRSTLEAAAALAGLAPPRPTAAPAGREAPQAPALPAGREAPPAPALPAGREAPPAPALPVGREAPPAASAALAGPDSRPQAPAAFSGRDLPPQAPAAFSGRDLPPRAPAPPQAPAAVAGRDAPPQAIAALAGRDAPPQALAAPAERNVALEALEAAIEARLLVHDDGVLSFPHPLVRAAIYHGLGPASRARLHLRAAAFGENAFKHRIAAASGPDEALADELEAHATAERSRAAWPGATTSLIAASRLSVTRADRDRRLLEALEASLYAGDGQLARRLETQTQSFEASPLRDRVLAYAAIEAGRGDEAQRLLDRAWEAEPSATIAQRRAFLESVRLNPAAAVEWARRALALARGDLDVALASWNLALGLDALGEPEAAHAALDDGIAALSPELRAAGTLADIRGALFLHDDRFAEAIEQLKLVKRHGSLVVAAINHTWLARAEYALGAWDDAAMHADRAVALAIEADDEGTQAQARWVAMLVPAARGTLEELETPPPGTVEAHQAWLALGAAVSGTPEAVVANLKGPGPFRWEPGARPWPVLYADALVDLGRVEEAEAFLARPWARRSINAGLERVRGRMTSDVAAFERAREGFAALGMPYELARVDIDLGRALRREGHRRRAAELLSGAADTLERLGAAPLLERALRELEACGLTPAPRKLPQRDRLTPRERVVARLAGQGLSNREIAAELMLSVKTVERHLSGVFAKQGISSRRELRNP